MKTLNILFKGKFTFINDSKVTEIKNVAFQKTRFVFFAKQLIAYAVAT